MRGATRGAPHRRTPPCVGGRASASSWPTSNFSSGCHLRLATLFSSFLLFLHSATSLLPTPSPPRHTTPYTHPTQAQKRRRYVRLLATRPPSAPHRPPHFDLLLPLPHVPHLLLPPLPDLVPPEPPPPARSSHRAERPHTTQGRGAGLSAEQEHPTTPHLSGEGGGEHGTSAGALAEERKWERGGGEGRGTEGGEGGEGEGLQGREGGGEEALVGYEGESEFWGGGEKEEEGGGLGSRSLRGWGEGGGGEDGRSEEDGFFFYVPFILVVVVVVLHLGFAERASEMILGCRWDSKGLFRSAPRPRTSSSHRVFRGTSLTSLEASPDSTPNITGTYYITFPLPRHWNFSRHEPAASLAAGVVRSSWDMLRVARPRRLRTSVTFASSQETGGRDCEASGGRRTFGVSWMQCSLGVAAKSAVSKERWPRRRTCS